MKKILYKNVDIKTSKGFQQQFYKHVDAIKKMADAIKKSGRRRLWSHCPSNLPTPTHDSTNNSIVIDVIHE